MKYLFLDIDGVLNSEEWFRWAVEHHLPADITRYFDPDCVGRVRRILEETDARLVISSSWRWDPKLEETFRMVCLPTDFDRTGCRRKWRGDEIDEFLHTHPCDGYVILDDDKDMLARQIPNFFLIDRWVGLTDADTERVIHHLKNYF